MNRSRQVAALKPWYSCDDAIRLQSASEPWIEGNVTAHHIMLKTLQQARMEGIWKPCLSYTYRWGDQLWTTDRGSRRNLGITIDVGIFRLSADKNSPRRQRLGLQGTRLCKIISEPTRA